MRHPVGGFFLFGPRGTGKSTWLRASRQGAIWLDLLDPEAQRHYLARPERLRELIAGHPEASDVVINEVQKVPALFDVVHGLVESDRRLRFVLTGSSTRKLRRGDWNLLAGRLLEAHMHPFMAAELGNAFNLQELWRSASCRWCEQPIPYRPCAPTPRSTCARKCSRSAGARRERLRPLSGGDQLFSRFPA